MIHTVDSSSNPPEINPDINNVQINNAPIMDHSILEQPIMDQPILEQSTMEQSPPPPYETAIRTTVQPQPLQDRTVKFENETIKFEDGTIKTKEPGFEQHPRNYGGSKYNSSDCDCGPME